MEFMKKTAADRMIEMGATTKLVQHDTLEECIAQFIPAEAMAAPDEWSVGALDTGDGIERTVGQFIEDVRRHQPCWGVCKQDVNEIHFWLSDQATWADVLALFAHEFGHLEPPVEENELADELRSEAFARVAVRALCAARETLGDSWIAVQLATDRKDRHR